MRVLGPKGLATVVDLLDAIALGSRGIHLFVTDRAEEVAAEIEARCPAGWVVAPLFAVERDRPSTTAERGSQDGHDVLLLGVVEAENASELPALHALNDQREWLLRRGVCAVVVIAGKDAQAADAAYLELQAHAPDLWSVRSRVYRAVGFDPERTMHDALLDLLSPKFGGDRALALRWLDGRAVSEEWIQNRLWREGPRREAWLAEAGASAVPSRLVIPDELRSRSLTEDIGPLEASPSIEHAEPIAPERWPRPAWPSGQLDEVQQTLVRALEAALDRDGFAELHILPEDEAPEKLTTAVLTVGLLRESKHQVVLHLDARNGLASAIYQHLHEAGVDVAPQGLFDASSRLRNALRGVDPLLLITDASATELLILRAEPFEIPVVASVRAQAYFTFCVAVSRAYEERARWAKQQLSSWAGGSTMQWVRTETAPLDLRMASGRARHVVTLIDATWSGIPRAAWQSLGAASQRVVALALTDSEPEVASSITWHGKLDADESNARDRLRAVARGLAGEPMLEDPISWSDPPANVGVLEEAKEVRALANAQRVLDPSDLPSALVNLGDRLSTLGLRVEALAATQEAVSQLHERATTRPDSLLPHLATALNHLGNRLSDLGRPEEALEAAQGAVELYQELQKDRERFLPDLAGTLSNLGNRLSRLGRRDEAMAATREAVEHFRKLARASRGAFLPELGMALNNLGIRLSGLGRREEAMAATQEAVEIRRNLAEVSPDAFLPDLASSLNNLGVCLSDSGHREEAMAATEQAVQIRRKLAEASPDAFRPDLASALNNLGIRLSDSGHQEEAMAATQEAIEIQRRLAEASPDAFLPGLAQSLGVLGRIQRERGAHAESLTSLVEGLRILLPFYLRLRSAHEEIFRLIVAELRRTCAAGALEVPADLREWVEGDPGEA